MNAKRWLAVLLAGIMVFSMVGCKSTGGTSDNGSEVVLQWYFPGDKQPDQDKVWAKFNEKVKEKINATVNINMIDRGSYNDKMTMMLASGTEFDICFTSAWTNNFIQGASKGAYLAIDDLLKKTPGFNTYMPDYVWNAAKYNGKIYAVPGYQVMFYQNAVVTTKELAEKYANNIPKNPQKAADFEPLVKAIKDGDPSLYPTQPLSDYTDFETIQSGISIKKDTTDYKVFNNYESDYYKSFLKQRYDWFQKGYFRPDLLTTTDDRNDRFGFKYGLLYGSAKPGGEAESRALYKKDMKVIPFGEAYISYSAGNGTMMAISRTSKNPERALKFLELLATDKELYNLFIYGIEGEHYTKDANDIVTLKPNTTYVMASQWMFGNQFNGYLQNNQDPQAWVLTDKMNKESKLSPLSGFVLSLDNIKTQVAQCESVIKEYSHIEKGTQDPDSIYPEFISKLKSAGIDQVQEEIQKQVTEWAKANGKIN